MPASPFLPGNQASRQQMEQYARQIAAGRPTFGSIGNIYTGAGGSIDPSRIPDYMRGQLTMTNIDDSGNGVLNFGGTGTDGITTRDGRSGMTQLGDTNGIWDHRYIKDWSQVTYDPEWGLITPQGNIQAQQNAAMRNFGLGIGAIGLAGLGSGLLGATAAGEGGIDSLVPGFVGAGEGDTAAVAAGLNSGGGGSLLGGAGFTPADYGMAEGYTGGAAASPFAGAGLTGSIEGGATGLSGLLGNAMNNPLGLLGLVQAGRGLLGGGGSSNPSAGSSGPGKGGTGTSGPTSRGTFNANPYTNAQIMNQQWIQPRNYRSGP